MNKSWVSCPHCGKEQKANAYKPGAVCIGVSAKCKNPACRKEFEIRIFDGRQTK